MKIRLQIQIWILVGVVVLFGNNVPTSASPVILSDVPAYEWYHGCTPTAIASVLGYWDLHGYSNLFTANGLDVFLTINVQDQISSPEHNAKYDPTPDNASLPIPQMTSIADWLRTSVDPAPFGGTSFNSVDYDRILGYTQYRGYDFNVSYQRFENLTSAWNNLVSEINLGHPLMFQADVPGGLHSVPVLGYDDRGVDGLWYGMYTTWTELETILWEPLRPISSSYDWGVLVIAAFTPPEIAPQVPESSTMLLLGSGLVGLVGLGRFRKKVRK